MQSLKFNTAVSRERINSDREVLPFPAGGVFGAPEHEKTVRELEQTLDTMQKQLDQLGEAVDDVLRFTEYTDEETEGVGSPNRPSAA